MLGSLIGSDWYKEGARIDKGEPYAGFLLGGMPVKWAAVKKGLQSIWSAVSLFAFFSLFARCIQGVLMAYGGKVSTILLPLGLLFLFASDRVSKWLPYMNDSNSWFATKFFFKKRPRPALLKWDAATLVELNAWYIAFAFVLYHLHRRFGFQLIGGDPGTFTLAGLGILVCCIMYGLIGVLLSPLIQELRALRRSVFRIAAALLLFALTDLLFATAYQVLMAESPAAFNGPLGQFADAFYFSTQTITLAASSDIQPLLPAAKITCSLETLTGVCFLAAVISFVVSIPNERQGHQANAPATSSDA